jgi:serpin B
VRSLSLAAALLLAACSAAPGQTLAPGQSRLPARTVAPAPPIPSLVGTDGSFASIDGANVLARGARVVDPGVSHDEIIELTDANAAFALDLYRTLAVASDDNILLGPQSISTALAMVHVGARGQTEADMAKVLHFDEFDGRVPERFNALDFALAFRQDPGVVDLRFANQTFGQPGLALEESYLETLSSQFGAPHAELDFGAPEAARGVINDWVADRTNDRIEELFPSGTIHPLTRLVLVNAMSLDATWRYVFDPAHTSTQQFTLADGETVDVPTMHFDLYLPQAWEPDYSAVELMYGKGDVSMVVILPEDLAEFEETVDPQVLNQIFDRISDGGIHLALPKFSFSNHVDMKAVLTEMGMGSAFGGDFSGMAPGVTLDTVQHEAFIEVDEEGTEAHAATGAGMAVSHGPTIEFNRPFFFVIRDRITGAILFVGRVSDPSAS